MTKKTQFNPRTQQAYTLLHEGTLALTRAEQQGMRVDLAYVRTKKIQLSYKINKLEQQFMSTKFFKHWQHTVKGKVNLNSTAQLSNFLYKIKGVKIEKETESGRGATDEEALIQMNIPELNDLLEIRKLKKVRDTYLDTFEREQVNGYIHPFFNLHLVRTFRSSSDHPNFQNIPKRDEESMQTCRKALFARPGHQLLEIDYSGLEVRIAACYHKDETMLTYINNPASDMHTDMARQIFMIDKFDKNIPSHNVLRQATKNGFVFPEFYGDYFKNCAFYMACNWGKLPQGKWSTGSGIELDTSFTLGDHLISKGINSLEKFEKHLEKIEEDFWGERFSQYAAWKKRWFNLYKKYGYIDMLTGFRCSGVMGKNDCINYPVQGAAFHCLLWSFVEIDKIIIKEKWDTRLVGQIHDSIILDVNPKELPHIVQTIHNITTKDLRAAWNWIIVPLDIDMELCPVDGSWAEKTKFLFKNFFV